MVFIDLTKAFDSTNRTGLWSLLAKFGCPSKLANVIKQLHDGMMGRVCADGMSRLMVFKSPQASSWDA